MYKYKVEMVENLPEEIKMQTILEIETQKEWFGHSYGEAVGRIYSDGEKESFFTHDAEGENTEWFDTLWEGGKLRSRRRRLINRESFETRECQEYYLMYQIPGHSSMKNTVMDGCLNNCANVSFHYVLEYLFILDDGLKRYLARDISTDGPWTYGMMDDIGSLEENIREWAEEGKYGFRNAEDRGINVGFYDDFGSQCDVEFASVDEFLLSLNSVRIISLESEIVG